MDIHCKVAAALSIFFSALGLLILIVMSLFLTGAAAMSGLLHGPMMMGFAAVGSVILGIFVLLMAAELVAGICYLRGVQSARIWLIVFNALSMLKFPIGTLIGGYCVWALVRRQPETTVVIIEKLTE